jgi:hypothetical protein
MAVTAKKKPAVSPKMILAIVVQIGLIALTLTQENEPCLRLGNVLRVERNFQPMLRRLFVPGV